MHSPTLAFTVGGTAGHVTPALAVAAACLERQPASRLLFLGPGNGTDATLVRGAGHRLHTVPAAPWFSDRRLARLRALGVCGAAIPVARRLLARESARLLFAFGGHASIAPVLAARSLRLPVALIEPNATPGLAVRQLARFATRIFLGDERARGPWCSRGADVVGVPIVSGLVTSAAERLASRGPHVPPRLLVMGGSLGSAFLNRTAPDMVAALVRGGIVPEVWHLSGGGELHGIRERYGNAGAGARVDALLDDVVPALQWADIAITSGGAVSLAELAAAAVPCIVVPLAAASEDHQTPNAVSFTAASGMKWWRERDWRTEEVAAHLRSLIDPAGWQAAVRGVHAAARPDAAETIARCMLEECVPPT